MTFAIYMTWAYGHLGKTPPLLLGAGICSGGGMCCRLWHPDPDVPVIFDPEAAPAPVPEQARGLVVFVGGSGLVGVT